MVHLFLERLVAASNKVSRVEHVPPKLHDATLWKTRICQGGDMVANDYILL